MNYYLLLVLFILLVFLLLRFHLKRLNLYKCSYALPGPRAWPILGNALWCLGNSEDIIKNAETLTRKYTSTFRFWLGSKLVVIISKPRDLEIVLNSSVQKEESIMRFLRPFLGNGLITARSVEWKLHRKVINPTFNQKILNSFIPTFVEHTHILVQKLNDQIDKNEFDIYKHISLNTLDFLCETTMGINVNAQNERSEYAQTLNRVLSVAFARMTQIWNHIDAIFYRSTTGKQFLKDIDIIHSFGRKVLKKKQEQFDKENSKDSHENKNQDADDILGDTNGTNRKAFLEHLLELKGNSNTFNETNIFDEINTFIAAGTDTVSSIISFVCMMLGSHQYIQDKVYNEVLEVLQDSDGSISNNDLQKLQYLERVIKETMRLFPATPLLIRSTTKPIQLESYLIPDETAVLYVILRTHRDPDLWPNPLRFDPDRFLPENSTNRHAFSYLPFGAGLRNCIGLRYAMMSMKVVLAILIQNYKFHAPCDIETLRLESSIVLKPVLGHLVKIESRLHLGHL